MLFRSRVLEIVQNPMVFRRGPLEILPCKPELLKWLVDHPQAAAEFWQHLGLEVSDVELIEDGYLCREGTRALVKFHVVLDTPDMRVLYCVGELKHLLWPQPLRAELVVVQRYKVTRGPEGSRILLQQLEGFASAKGPTVKFAMKLGKQTAQRVVDQSMQEMSIYFAAICRLIELRPGWSIEAAPRIQEKHPHIDFASFHEMVKELSPPTNPSASDVMLTEWVEAAQAQSKGKNADVKNTVSTSSTIVDVITAPNRTASSAAR